MKTAVFAFGRMNPPTIGHKKLVDKVSSIAGDHFVFLSHASGNKTQKPGTKQYENKDPLPFSDKLAFVDVSFPTVTVGDSNVKTVMDAMKKLQADGYTDVIMVAGSDRVDSFTELLNKYQGTEYDFNTIEVVSAGERDPDAEGADGMSASKMRAAVRAGDFESFKQGSASPQIAKPMFDMLTKILKQNPMPGDAFKESRELKSMSKYKKQPENNVLTDVDTFFSESEQNFLKRSKERKLENNVLTRVENELGEKHIVEVPIEEVNLDEAKLNIKKIHKAVDDGKSMDVIVGMFADKLTTNTDEIRKITKDYMFKRRNMKEEFNLDELLVNNPNPNLDNKATWKRDPKQSNLKLPDKLSRHGKRSALAKMVPRMQNILTSVKEMDLDREQLQGVMNKASKLMIEIELAEKHTVVENLYHLDLDDVMQSSVLVKGVGRYSVEGLMQNIREKLDDLSQEARSMSPFDYKNIKSKLDSGIVSKMLDSLTQAFDDLENARRKGGPASRSIPKNIFDDTTLVELDLFRKKSTGPKQSTALAVLDNVANRSSQTPFPVRMYDKTVIEVTPKIAKQIIDLYDGSNDRVKGVIEDLLKTKNGFKELVQKVTKKR